MSDKFTEREKGFEKKFARDEELQFKVQARGNKYLAEFVNSKLGKTGKEQQNYVLEIIKADMEEAGQEFELTELEEAAEEPEEEAGGFEGLGSLFG